MGVRGLQAEEKIEVLARRVHHNPSQNVTGWDVAGGARGIRVEKRTIRRICEPRFGGANPTTARNGAAKEAAKSITGP
jgi:hypothetical protein